MQTTARQWCQALATAEGAAAALKDLTRYGLQGHAQHVQLLQCPGLVHALVQQLEPSTPGTAAAACWDAARVEAALEAAISLTISQEGLQALLYAGALKAAGRVLNACCPTPCCQHNPKKRKLCKGNSSAHSPPTDADEDALQDTAVLALQLLAALLLEPSAARPRVGSLNNVLAANTAAAILQVLPGLCWTVLSVKQQQDAAAVLMRLAMEPAVADVVCQQAAAAAAGARDSPHQHQSSTQHITGQASSRQDTSQLDGLSGLLQQHMSVQHFLTSHWETQPVVFPKSAAKQPLHATQQAGAPAAQPLPTGDPVTTTSQGSAAEDLAVQLTPWGVLSELLPRGQHCPVLPAASDDPVQVLQDLRTQRQLLQPLQPHTDLRVIKTQLAMPAGGSPQDAPLDRTGPHSTQEVLWGFDDSVSTDACVAALQAGFTIVLRDMPKRCPAVAALVDELEAQLGLPAGANMYLTPAGAQGLKAHYDDHCVFVLQLAGSKTWFVGPPQHPPLPLAHEPRLPVVPVTTAQQPSAATRAAGAAAASWQPAQALGAEQPPPIQQAAVATCSWPQEVVLHPGDCLYIPRGWVHQAATGAAAEAAAAAAVETEGGQGGTVAGSSLHVSVGVEVAAGASVQGFLHHLLDVCASRATAGTCRCSLGASDAHVSSQQPHVWLAAVRAASLRLHVRLWCLARTLPWYRKACPIFATGSAAHWMSDVLCEQLSLAARTNHTTAVAAAAAGAAETQGCAPSGEVHAAVAMCAHEQLQPHQQWMDSVVQQLATDGVSVSDQAQLLSQLISQSLLEDGSSNSGSAALAADSQPDSNGGLLSLHSWLTSSLEEGASLLACSACGSSCCHSALLCTAVMQGSVGGAVPEAWEEHAASCTCCSPRLAAVGGDAVDAVLDRSDAALAAVLRSLRCAACRTDAVVRRARTGTARLAACQALRRAFVAAGTLSLV